MKKTFSLVALLLAVIMIAMCCVACGDDKKSDDAAAPTTVDGTDAPATEAPADITTASIVGTWMTKIDFESMIDAMMQSQGDVAQETVDMYKKMFEGIVISFGLTFDADSNCELAVDDASMADMVDKIKANLKANISDVLAMSGLTEQALADNGYTVDSYIDMVAASMDTSKLSIEDKKGTYRLDGNKLYISTEDNPNNDNYVEIELTANTLSIVGGSGINDDSALFAEAMLPLVFTRV